MNAWQVSFVVPDSIDDDGRVSGGNVYDRHLRDGLRELGWVVTMVAVSGQAADTQGALRRIPDGSVVLIDGLLAVQAPAALVAHEGRLRLVVLAHMVASGLGDETSAGGERAALSAARRIVATSSWTRSELVELGLDADRIVVASPGIEPASVSTLSETGGRLLCVGVIARHKGQDLLVRALAKLADIEGWTCALVGSQRVSPDFAVETAALVGASGLADRITFTGVLTGAALAAEFAQADLLVAPSRAEAYGMAVAEALSHAVPVLATRVGGLPEAVSYHPAGIFVPPGDIGALAAELRAWLTDRARRESLTSEALKARTQARPWRFTADVVASALADLVPAS